MNPQPQTEQAAMNRTPIELKPLLDIEDELGHVIATVRMCESLGIENSRPTVTGNEVAHLMGILLDQLRPIQDSLNQYRKIYGTHEA